MHFITHSRSATGDVLRLEVMKDCKYCGKRPWNPGYDLARKLVYHSEIFETFKKRRKACGRRSCDLF